MTIKLRNSAETIRWGYGITTVPEREATTFRLTLASMKAAGFDDPHVFVDGDDLESSLCYHVFENCTMRRQRVRAYGHWLLSLLELYIRHPTAHRYALFQDDVICCKGLRAYLDAWHPPAHGYWNLYTVTENYQLLRSRNGGNPPSSGWFESNQQGRGALALVFSAEMARHLLLSRNIMEKPHDPNTGWRKIDGAVSEALSDEHSAPRGASPPFREWCHYPSLVQHIGEETTIVGTAPVLDPATGKTRVPGGSGGAGKHGKSPCFMGEEWDATSLLKSELPAPLL